jgi:hypothetical protein
MLSELVGVAQRRETRQRFAGKRVEPHGAETLRAHTGRFIKTTIGVHADGL